MSSTLDTVYLIPELATFEERMKRRCFDATIISTEKIILYCVLTMILILITVTFSHQNNYFNLCGTSNK